ncbi:histidine kinase dimerization/phosphoacceptor domain-containing protein [Nocardioides kongjuensis]|uniref:histidine kinase dimerization/phosphoacceptor domain-containing protein n=1 Tax=Nocardioides kongjuensis TaxID=349522 RepID=UPI003CD06F7A
MHDTLSHHLSLIALHAGALGRRDDLPADTVRSSSRLVADLSRTAHAELREVLGVLHRDEVPAAPPAGAGSSRSWSSSTGRPGHGCEPCWTRRWWPTWTDGSPRRRRGCSTGSSASCSPTRRGTPPRPVELVVEGGDRVRVECRNPMPGRVERSGDGLGLEGIAERVRLAGGRHRAAPSTARSWWRCPSRGEGGGRRRRAARARGPAAGPRPRARDRGRRRGG